MREGPGTRGFRKKKDRGGKEWEAGGESQAPRKHFVRKGGRTANEKVCFFLRCSVMVWGGGPKIGSTDGKKKKLSY